MHTEFFPKWCDVPSAWGGPKLGVGPGPGVAGWAFVLQFIGKTQQITWFRGDLNTKIVPNYVNNYLNKMKLSLHI